MKTIKAVAIPFDYNLCFGDADGLSQDDKNRLDERLVYELETLGKIKQKFNKHDVELFETYVYCPDIRTFCCCCTPSHWCEPLGGQYSANKDLIDILSEEELEVLGDTMCYNLEAKYFEIDEDYKTKTLETYTEKRAKEISKERKEDIELALLEEAVEWNIGDWVF